MEERVAAVGGGTDGSACRAKASGDFRSTTWRRWPLRRTVSSLTDWQPSDGVVTMASQRWSGRTANQERTINNADSHVGSTKSDKVKDQLLILLDVANR